MTRGHQRRCASSKKEASSPGEGTAGDATPGEDPFDWQSVWNLVKFGAFLHCLHEYVVEVSMCCGPSMLPTFNMAGDIVLMDRISPRLGRIRVGDVVICKSPTHPHQTVCKRVAALEDEKAPGFRQAVVPKGHMWLLGDNPDNSTDSRVYGPVPTSMVKGRVFCRVFPFDQLAVY